MIDKLKYVLMRDGLNALGLFSPRWAGRLALQIFTQTQRHPLPDWEAELIKQGKSITFKNGLRGTEWGKGPTVILLHGWGGRGTQLGALVVPLVEEGYRVIALDGLAHGKSPGTHVIVVEFSRALRAVVDETGFAHAVVSHSFGGAATALALKEGMKANRAVLVGTPSDVQVVINNFVRGMRLSKRVATQFQKQLERRAGFKAPEIHINQIAPQIKVPGLIIHDRNDKEVRFVCAEEIVAAWPGAKLLATKGKGHRRILRDPEFVNAVREFLKLD